MVHYIDILSPTLMQKCFTEEFDSTNSFHKNGFALPEVN